MAGANIKIGANSSEFQKQMKEVTTNLKLVSSECGVASEKAKLFGNASDKLGASQKELSSKIQAQNKIIKLYQDRIVGINGEIDKQKTKQTDLSKKIEDTTKKHKDSVEATGKNSEESKKLQKELTGLKEEYAKNEKAIEGSNKKLTDATVKMNNAERALLQNQGALQDVNKEIGNLKLDKLEKGLDKVSETSGKLSDKMKPASTAIVGLGVASATASITFEDSMAKVMTIADKTEMSYDDMKKSILDLSNQTGISANEISDNVYNAISAGQSTGDAVNFVTNSTKLAKAGFADAGQSLDLLTTIMNSYGLEADQVGNVSDTLIQVQNKGKTTVSELASSMGKIIPTANSMGVSLDQLGAGYALMTSKGIATAETTTYMNSLLNELGKSGTKASDLLKSSTGKTFQELTEAGIPLADVLVILEEESKKNGKSLADMFGSAEAGKAALVLATDSGDAFNNMLKSMGESTGATDEAFKTMSETTGNKLKVSLNEVKNSGISMGDTLAPVVSSLASGFGNVTSALSNLSSTQLTTIAGIGAGIVTVNLALGAFSKFTGGLRDGVKAFKDVKEFSGKAITNIKDFSSKALNGAKSAGNLALSVGKSSLAFAKSAIQAGISGASFIAHKVASMASTVATNAMSVAQGALNLVMSMNPITLIIIAITALVAAIVLLWNKCEWFRNMCTAMFDALKVAWDVTLTFFKAVWDKFVGLWNAAVEGIKIVWNKLCDLFKIVWNGVCEYFKLVWNTWKSVFETVGNAIKAVWQGICNIINSIWNGIVNGITNVWNGFKIIFETVGNGIKAVWQGICNIIRSIWSGIVNTINNIWNGFKSIFETVSNSISSIWRGITGTISNVWNGVVGGIKSAWNTIIAPFQSVVDAIGGIWQSVRSMFKLPHFTITGSLNPLKWGSEGMPKVGVDWYYKGGIFNTPTVLGGVGVGDMHNGQGSKSEAVVPIDSLYRNIDSIINKALGNTNRGINQTLNIYSDNINEEKVAKATKKSLRDLALSAGL